MLMPRLCGETDVTKREHANMAEVVPTLGTSLYLCSSARVWPSATFSGRLACSCLLSCAMAKRELLHESDWKQRAVWTDDGYFRLETADTGDVVVRLFVTKGLLTEAEPTLYRQIVNATRFPRRPAVSAHISPAAPPYAASRFAFLRSCSLR